MSQTLPPRNRTLALLVLAIVLAFAGIAGGAARAASQPETQAVVARGRYLVVIAGCNDCHTRGWRDADGGLPVSSWLTGSDVGFRTAAGTSYPTNLRLNFQMTAEEQWNTAVRTRGGHDPMVWQNLRTLTAADRHAIYAFIRSLGPGGRPAPIDVPPWEEPATRYIDLRIQSPRP